MKGALRPFLGREGMRVRPLPRPGRHPGVGITPTSRVLVLLPRAAIPAQRTPAGLSARMSPPPPAQHRQARLGITAS